ncbi:MAG: GLPGLI family protein, partial [Phaeodactylibacter sp.]|nr:GLPGLI family protein [Phaeodactylibacter sp.]
LILGYNCIEATTESDSTTIHAWFAPQIPISVGPGEITGLPGAILSANFKNGDQSVLIEAQQLEFEAVNDKIVQPEKGKKVNQEEFEEIVQKRMEEMEKMYGGDSESSGDGNIRIKVIRE